ncbi:MAG TPA: biotin/lipoyl-binding protein, partial [Nannocystis sp.]
MFGKLSGKVWSIQFAVSLALSACSGAKGTAPEPAPEAQPQVLAGDNAGEVRLSPASMAYVKVEAVNLEPEHAVIRAPARVAFRDGAVSKVGAPIPGRVMKLHVEAGAQVKVGDPLVTIASPEASGFHMDLARARIELTAAKDNYERQSQMVAKGVGRDRGMEAGRQIAGYILQQAAAGDVGERLDLASPDQRQQGAHVNSGGL